MATLMDFRSVEGSGYPLPSTKIKLEFNLIKSDKLDFCPKRADFYNWIPFVFQLKVGENEVYSYPKEYGTQVSVEEMKCFFKNMGKLFDKIEKRDNMAANSQSETIKENFFTMETYFGLDFVDAYDNFISLTVWVRMCNLPQFNESGFDRGFCYTVALSDVKNFMTELENEFKCVINNCKESCPLKECMPSNRI
jgi:hypothetical protein